MTRLLAWINLDCSKCRGLVALLEQLGQEADYRHYLDDPPSAQELQQACQALGLDHPRELARAKDARYAELNLAEATPEQVLVALAANPKLIERPVLFQGERALIARPPELAEAWLSEGQRP